jgi:hypothetical protein
MLYRKIIAVCSQIHTKHINTLCGQNVELYIKTQSVPHSKHSIAECGAEVVIPTVEHKFWQKHLSQCYFTTTNLIWTDLESNSNVPSQAPVRSHFDPTKTQHRFAACQTAAAACHCVCCYMATDVSTHFAASIFRMFNLLNFAWTS